MKAVFLIAWILTQPALPAWSQSVPESYPRNADLGVNEVYLNFRLSSERRFGKEFELKTLSPKLTYLKCLNADRSEVLTLLHHEGADLNTFQEFEVASRSEDAEVASCHLKEVDHFSSFRGVKLGSTLSEIISVFGDDYRAKSEHTIITLEYENASSITSPFLRFYNRQRYYGSYTFRGGKLIRFGFGFDRRY